MTDRMLKSDLLKKVPPIKDEPNRLAEIQELNNRLNKKIIVLDDDPTGTQTVHNVTVLTSWDKDNLRKAFLEEGHVFYILTNSRSLNSRDAKALITDIMNSIIPVSRELSIDFIVIDRGDSTLRGHYPLESSIIRSAIQQELSKKIDGEIIIPFFKEGRRFTFNDIHWIEEGDYWIPVGETEFSKDPAFGYNNSDLKLWIEEKTHGSYTGEDVVSITLDHLRVGGVTKVYDILMSQDKYRKIIVNAVDYPDLEVFVTALLKAEIEGKNYTYRTAASFVRVRGGIEPRELLKTEELVNMENKCGGLAIIGSHVKKSTIQLEHALKADNVIAYEVDVERLLSDTSTRDSEVENAVRFIHDNMVKGINILVYTSRKLIRLEDEEREKNLDISQKVSQALVDIVKSVKETPRFIIAKGGITSSDIATKGLNIKKTTVLGQIRPGIPVWAAGNKTGYIVFPGNVGEAKDLKGIIEQLGCFKR